MPKKNIIHKYIMLIMRPSLNTACIIKKLTRRYTSIPVIAQVQNKSKEKMNRIRNKASTH